MPWYIYTVAGMALFLAAVSALMLVPLRIFIHYLRENNKDRARLGVKLACLELRAVFFRAAPEERFALVLRLWRWELRIPVSRRRSEREAVLCIGRRKYVLPPAGEGLKKAPELFQRARPYLKKMLWRSFNLELVFGLEDPAATGLLAGSGWFAGGLLCGLLESIFTFAAAPRIDISPRFERPAFKLRWEGELSMALFRWLGLWMATRKIIGGATSGSSSH